MLIAREKRKTNLAEYVLYMWQLEDMLRALGLDIEQVTRHVVEAYQVDEAMRKELREWYDNLIEMMKREQVMRTGHLQVVKNMVNELTELHFQLLHERQDARYQQVFMRAANNLLDYRRKSNLASEISDVELALHALYGHLMLKLQKKELNSQTITAMESFSRMLGYLSAVYRQMEEDEQKEDCWI